MKSQNLDNREKLCCNCCNDFPDDEKYPNCPFCLHEGGMLISKDNRIALQGRHIIIRLPLGMIKWEVLNRIVKKERNENTQNKSFKKNPFVRLARKLKKRNSSQTDSE